MGFLDWQWNKEFQGAPYVGAFCFVFLGGWGV